MSDSTLVLLNQIHYDIGALGFLLIGLTTVLTIVITVNCRRPSQ